MSANHLAARSSIDGSNEKKSALAGELYTPVEIDQLQCNVAALSETLAWVRNFCAKPHPGQGRPGPVCPFVPLALHLNTIWLTVVRTKNREGLETQIEATVERYRDIFFDLEPRAGEHAVYKSILLIFPDIHREDAPRLIDMTQRKLKPHFVKLGLMLGEFHELIETAGLHSRTFYPLRSPIPMLVIRSLVESDFPFLLRKLDSPYARIQCLEAYLELMGARLSSTQLYPVHEALDRARLEWISTYRLETGKDITWQPE